ncbi:unnamed protein product [Acanthoscelides obtectus]|uniref:DUF4371 domain-containing protein n=1 Tax=Acanthoscelides obtectus TaxID=200917 RepID=A0A9P0QJA5_ACAOB|nr:unnamed protein product [Acanthoscelides obtectus]CAH2021382.1 unnamed protein product [Acanthoscelides obtectus]CAK1685595.1 hypothetical protein AOBTE_LOCUS35531 [Acanthoscelides obtectus]CAK1685667.1 hypothetical protein AOBTE_LOCUS35555 [Acanthoscelides obtectus]
MNNVFSFSILGKLNIRTQLNSAYRNDLIKHNNQVDNRYVLNKIINCIRFCGAFELALRGHDEKENSENSGIFKELVNFSAELDNELKVHIQSAKLFKGTSKTTQNELLECMLDVYHEEVKKEIPNSPFVAVIADETTDVACEFQYLCKGQPVERFWRFYVPDGHDAKSIAACVLNVVNPLLDQNPKKLIAQSYDGASVMSGELNGVQKIIKETYPLAKLPRSSQTRWNFQSRGVHTVYENRKDLIEVMDNIESTSRDCSSINQASGYKLKLQDTNFVFWLSIFHKIMPHVEIVFNQLQKVCTDSVKVKNDLENFEAAIQTIREQMDSIIDEIERVQRETDEPPRKKGKLKKAAKNGKR